MHFEIVHDFEIPRDALELAVVSPTLVDKLAPRLPNVESIKQLSHVLRGHVLERVWSYSPNVKVPDFARPWVTRDMLHWEDHSTYDMKTHEAKWTIVPRIKPAWRKYFRAEGTYAVLPNGEGGCSRVIHGDLDLIVPLFRGVAERLIVNEVRKSFEAEAATLRELATLV